MARTITKKQYRNYVTEWVAWTGEQWLMNGIGITFTLDCDDDYYYLTVEVQNHVYDFYDENPEYDRSELEKAEEFCEKFGCKICESLDEVNDLIEKELPSYCRFAEGENGVVYGY